MNAVAHRSGVVTTLAVRGQVQRDAVSSSAPPKNTDALIDPELTTRRL
jgi:hypothetical protein